MSLLSFIIYIYCHFRKDLSNSTRSICRVAIQSHESQDYKDLETMTACFDVSDENYSDDSDFSMSSASGYVRSESSEVNKCRLKSFILIYYLWF